MADVEFTIEAIDKSTAAIQGIRGAIFSLNQAVGVANQAWRTANQVIDATVGSFVKYADQVRTLQQLTNESAESMSRLIQVADDYKISAEDLTTASRKLATQGFSLNVETIASLSDQYLQLNTGAERQLFLTENLGRASATWTDIMVQGSDAILSRNAAVSEALILDQQALDNARNYQFAVDDLTDSFNAYKMGLTGGVIPALITLIDYQVALMNRSDESHASWMRWIPGLNVLYSTYIMVGDAIARLLNLMSGLGVTQFAMDVVGGVKNAISGPKVPQKGTSSIPDTGWDRSAFGKASGGYVSGRYAITGDSLSGRPTGYEELVDFQQKRVYSAPETRSMGAVPGYAAGSGDINLSRQTINDLTDLLTAKLAPFL